MYYIVLYSLLVSGLIVKKIPMNPLCLRKSNYLLTARRPCSGCRPPMQRGPDLDCCRGVTCWTPAPAVLVREGHIMFMYMCISSIVYGLVYVRDSIYIVRTIREQV